MKIAVLVTTILFLSGCIPYPVYKTLQPKAEARIVDSTGKSVDAAEVYLVSSTYPYRREKFRMISESRNGYARFPKISEWRIEMLIIHGSEEFFWNWCVVSGGHKTISTNFRSAREFDENPTFTLEPGTSEACPEELVAVHSNNSLKADVPDGPPP